MTDPSKLLLTSSARRSAVPVHAVTKDDLKSLQKSLPAVQKAWITQNGFEAAAGTHLLVPDENGKLSIALYGKPGADARGQDR